MEVFPAGVDFQEARGRLTKGDADVELLEIEITVLRSHGQPMLRAVTEHSAVCPCCGEIVTIEDARDD